MRDGHARAAAGSLAMLQPRSPRYPSDAARAAAPGFLRSFRAEDFSWQMVRDLIPAAASIAVLCAIESLLSAVVADVRALDLTPVHLHAAGRTVAGHRGW